MGVLICIVCMTLGLSLYDFFSSRDSERLSTQVAFQKNQKYGAYALRKTYNLVLTSILLIFSLTFAAYISYDRVYGGLHSLEKIPHTDTFLLTLNAPPLEHIETLPPSFKLNGKEGAGPTKSASEAREEIPEEATPNELKSNVEPNNVPENVRSTEKNSKSTSEKKNKTKSNSVEQDVKDFERRLFEESKGVKERERIQREAEENRRIREEKKRNQQTASSQSSANEGGNNGAKGKTMVNFELKGRTPHNNDMWYVRNPGYTCGQGLSGEVVVKIKVNSNGDVTEATIQNDVSNLNPCLIKQAKDYAKKSRFNPSELASQEGKITYRFVP